MPKQERMQIMEQKSTNLYRVPVIFQAWGTISVEATNEQDLLRKLKDSNVINDLPLPHDWEYVDDSFEIDFDSLNAHYLNQ